MAFNRPTLQTLIQRVQRDIDSRLAGADSFILRSVLYVVAKVLAALAYGLYGHQAYIARQIIPDTADSENLERHAYWLGRGMTRNPATSATGSVTFTGAGGSVIPAGTTLQRSDGIEYTTDAEGVIASGTVDVAVTADSAGQETNASAGQSLSLVSPIGGVQSSATVAAGGLTGGTDAETDAQLLSRLTTVVRQTPHGGADADYDIWAREVSGVTRVWVMPQWNGAGTVGVFFARDDDDSIIPDAGEVATVQDYIDTVRPVTADVTVYAPTAAAIDMTIQLAPNDSTTQAAVQAELEDLLLSEANVEDGTGSGTILISRVHEAISRADGETDHALITPTANITPGLGELAILGTITWQELA